MFSTSNISRHFIALQISRTHNLCWVVKFHSVTWFASKTQAETFGAGIRVVGGNVFSSISSRMFSLIVLHQVQIYLLFPMSEASAEIFSRVQTQQVSATGRFLCSAQQSWANVFFGAISWTVCHHAPLLSWDCRNTYPYPGTCFLDRSCLSHLCSPNKLWLIFCIYGHWKPSPSRHVLSHCVSRSDYPFIFPFIYKRDLITI